MACFKQGALAPIPFNAAADKPWCVFERGMCQVSDSQTIAALTRLGYERIDVEREPRSNAAPVEHADENAPDKPKQTRTRRPKK